MHAYEPVPPPPPNPTAGRPRRARRLVVPLCVLGAAALLVPVLWATGGLAETPKQPAANPGRPVNLGLFSVTVRDARIGIATASFSSVRERFLIVRMRVVNQGKETQSLGSGGLTAGVAARTKDGKWVKPDRVEGVAAGAKTDAVQPGLPVEAAAMWKAGPADSPKTLTVGLREWKYDHGFTDSTFTWRVEQEDDALAGRMTLSVAPPAPVPPQRPSVGPGGRTPGSSVGPGGRTPGSSTGRPMPRRPRPTVSRR